MKKNKKVVLFLGTIIAVLLMISSSTAVNISQNNTIKNEAAEEKMMYEGKKLDEENCLLCYEKPEVTENRVIYPNLKMVNIFAWLFSRNLGDCYAACTVNAGIAAAFASIAIASAIAGLTPIAATFLGLSAKEMADFVICIDGCTAKHG